MHMEDDFEIIDEVDEEPSTESPTTIEKNSKERTTQLIKNLVINETSLTLSLSVNKLLSF